MLQRSWLVEVQVQVQAVAMQLHPAHVQSNLITTKQLLVLLVLPRPQVVAALAHRRKQMTITLLEMPSVRL